MIPWLHFFSKHLYDSFNSHFADWSQDIETKTDSFYLLSRQFKFLLLNVRLLHHYVSLDVYQVDIGLLYDEYR